MASRILLRTYFQIQPFVTRRQLSTSRSHLQDATVAPVKRPVGAFRGGLTGFLLGSVLSGAGMYYYVLNEYRVSNELLTEDMFNLQATVQRIEAYVKTLEDQLASKK